MLRLMPFIKKYWFLFILAILLIFGMANADLALPDQLSKIVNVGIQQNGIDQATPTVLRQKVMNDLKLFMTESDFQKVMADYHLVEKNSTEYVDLIKQFPNGADESFLARNVITPEEELALEGIMSKPLVMTMGLQLIQSNPEMATKILGTETQTHLGSLPQGIDLVETLGTLSEQQRTVFLQRANSQLDALEGTMLHSLAVRAVSAEYTAMGLDMQKSQSAYIWKIGRQMILLALAAVVCSILVSLIAARTSASIAHDLRQAVFSKVQGFSSAEYNNFSTASLITRSTNDVAQVQMLMFMVVRMGFMAPIIATMGVIRAVGKSQNMWWIIALAVSLLTIVIATAFILATPKFKLMQKLVDRINLVTRENLSGMMVVRAFNKQPTEEKRFDDVNKDLTKTGLFVGHTMASIFPLANLIMTGLNALIIWVGAREVANSTMMVGDLIAFQQYSMQIMFAFINLSFLSIMIPRAAVSGNRIADVLGTKSLITDPIQPKVFLEPVKGVLEFRDVSFAYDGADETALCGISFTSRPGEVTSIIGSTGSGKSTLVNLIPRLFDVTGGSILLDGIDIREVTQHNLRQQVSLVPQKAYLFSGTIRSNLEVGKQDASEEEMSEAILDSQAKEFVFGGESNQGLDREIAQAGANVSGGQKQRLSIARALIKNAPVLIFDDSFSALDYKTDANLRRVLSNEYAHTNMIIVTQRVATARHSDQILVLDDGDLVGIGKHKDLMESCQTYREIASSQLSPEELAA
ncbi:MAG TPA: ABC transporter ATP-binding protein [Anaerolineaceae bacterium]|nr:ABC transporter ATP-binding protein [Anaerolineaceae bacterium]